MYSSSVDPRIEKFVNVPSGIKVSKSIVIDGHPKRILEGFCPVKPDIIESVRDRLLQHLSSLWTFDL
jgi:hypothetical protein